MSPPPRIAGSPERRRAAFTTLERLSFTHSAVYTALLAVWLVPGLHGAELVLGLSHGIGWIAMCLLTLGALRARVVTVRIAVAVVVIGGVGPFVGSYEFVRHARASGPRTGSRS